MIAEWFYVYECQGESTTYCIVEVRRICSRLVEPTCAGAKQGSAMFVHHFLIT